MKELIAISGLGLFAVSAMLLTNPSNDEQPPQPPVEIRQEGPVYTSIDNANDTAGESHELVHSLSY